MRSTCCSRLRLWPPNIRRVLCSDWLPGAARWIHLARVGFPALVPQKRQSSLFGHIIILCWPRFFGQDGWILDSFLFCVFIDFNFISVHKNEKMYLANIQPSWPHPYLLFTFHTYSPYFNTGAAKDWRARRRECYLKPTWKRRKTASPTFVHPARSLSMTRRWRETSMKQNSLLIRAFILKSAWGRPVACKRAPKRRGFLDAPRLPRIILRLRASEITENAFISTRSWENFVQIFITILLVFCTKTYI